MKNKITLFACGVLLMPSLQASAQSTPHPIAATNAISNRYTNTAIIPSTKLEEDGYDWMGRHKEILVIKDKLDPDIIFIGDSITHAWGSQPKTGGRTTGEKVLTTAFSGRRVLNLGFGWDRTQNVLWRLDNGELDGLHPRSVIIHIGTNNTSDTPNARENTPTEIVEGIGQIIQRVKTKTPQAKIILMAVFPREEKPDHPRRLKIKEINRLLAAEYSKKKDIVYLDIGSKLTQPDGTISRQIMSDFCHPTEQGYRIWAEALVTEL